MHKVLTIAGSDPCGGAGIQADLKTFQAFGIYGMSVVTAVTAQNTVSFAGALEVSAKLVALQIDSVMSDIGADVWKTGMLATSEVVKTVAAKAKQYRMKKLVVDPVMAAKSGKPLLARDGIKTLIKELTPLTLVLTPNIDEAEVLTGIEIASVSDMKKAAVAIHKMGARHVVVKGGHLGCNHLGRWRGNDLDSSEVKPAAISPPSGGLRPPIRPPRRCFYPEDVIDILFDGIKFYEFCSPRVKTRNTHGTGCVFASAVAAELAKGKDVYEAVARAKAYITSALKRGTEFRIGHGNGPIMV